MCCISQYIQSNDYMKNPSASEYPVPFNDRRRSIEDPTSEDLKRVEDREELKRNSKQDSK